MLCLADLVKVHLAALRAADLVKVHLVAIRAADLVNVHLAGASRRLRRPRTSPKQSHSEEGFFYTEI